MALLPARPHSPGGGLFPGTGQRCPARKPENPRSFRDPPPRNPRSEERRPGPVAAWFSGRGRADHRLPPSPSRLGQARARWNSVKGRCLERSRDHRDRIGAQHGADLIQAWRGWQVWSDQLLLGVARTRGTKRVTRSVGVAPYRG